MSIDYLVANHTRRQRVDPYDLVHAGHGREDTARRAESFLRATLWRDELVTVVSDAGGEEREYFRLCDEYSDAGAEACAELERHPTWRRWLVEGGQAPS